MTTFLFYQNTDLEYLDEAESRLIEATGVFLVEAEDVQEALDILSDEIILAPDEVKNYRVTTLEQGKSITRKLTISD